MTEFDAIVLGMGPGGEDLAGQLAQAGLSTLGIDAELVGGECPYWGCIPSKMMVRAADLLAEGRRIPGMAGESKVSPDWAPVAKRIRDEATDNWDDKVAVDRFVGKGGTFVRGWGKVVGPKSVAVNGETYTARQAIVLNTGARAWVPPMFEAVPHWTNRDAVEAEVLPETLLVIGGGAIGLEIGQVMSRFGVEVTIVELGPRLAGPEEPEASALITEIFEREGISVHTGVQIESVVATADGAVALTLGDGAVLLGERMLVATGRRVDLAAVGVGALGVDESAKALPVDGFMRVQGAPGVWGIGDMTGKGAFTHVSMYQARIAAADILGQPTSAADYRAVPRVTFTDPEIGSVGMTEAQAREDGGEVTVMSEPIPKSTRGWIHKGEGFVKLVASDGVLVGATAMSPGGGEVLSMLTLAIHARVPVATLKDMIYAYPTFHRAIDSALWSS